MTVAMRQRTHAPSLRRGRVERQPTSARPPSLHSAVLALQRTSGNVATQRILQRQPPVAGKKKPKIDYDRAMRRNQKYAKSLKWDGRLAQLMPAWDKEWKAANYGNFADLVAEFQDQQGDLGADGELGPGTWNRLRPLGEVVAERSVSWAESEYVCSTATHERLIEGYSQGTGKQLVGKGQSDHFRVILHSITERMKDVDEQYRATGAAGALVFLGKGTFVTQEQIWKDKALLPGAAMQVWVKQSDFERVKQGKEPKSIGTSFVFVEYVGEDAMKVKHYSGFETIKKSRFAYWVGANISR